MQIYLLYVTGINMIVITPNIIQLVKPLHPNIILLTKNGHSHSENSDCQDLL